MPRGSKSKYTSKQKRQAEKVEKGYEKRGVSEGEAERRAWATINKMTGGGKKSGSGRGKSVSHESARKGGRKGAAQGGLGRARVARRGQISRLDGGRAAARALADSLVFCERAQMVTVATVTGEKDLGSALGGAQAVRHLASHGVAAKAAEVPAAEREASAALLAHAERIGAEPYICINLGTGTVRDAYEWVEYTNEKRDTALARERRLPVLEGLAREMLERHPAMDVDRGAGLLEIKEWDGTVLRRQPLTLGGHVYTPTCLSAGPDGELVIGTAEGRMIRTRVEPGPAQIL